MRRLIAPRPRPLQLLDRLKDAEPRPVPLRVASLGPFVGLRGGEDGHGRRPAVAQTDGTIWVRSVKGSWEILRFCSPFKLRNAFMVNGD